MLESKDLGCLNPNNDISYYSIKCPAPVRLVVDTLYIHIDRAVDKKVLIRRQIESTKNISIISNGDSET